MYILYSIYPPSPPPTTPVQLETQKRQRVHLIPYNMHMVCPAMDDNRNMTACFLAFSDRASMRSSQILAPTDSAFEQLMLDSSNIAEANRTALAELLRYHVMDGDVMTSSMDDAGVFSVAGGAGTLAIVGGDDVYIQDEEGRDASILVGNLNTSNGVLHAIDKVLMPFPEEQLTGEMFSDDSGSSGRSGNVEVAALSAGLAAAFILIAAAVAVHKRRQADAAKPPQIAPDDEGWGVGGANMRGAAIHPA